MPPKTARERAEEALAVADRRVKKLKAKRDELTAERRANDAAIAEAVQRRDYAAKHPDLSDNGIIALPEATEDRP